MNLSTTPRWRAVSFDAGGTLIQPWPSVGHVYAAAAADSGFGEFAPEELDRRFARVWQKRGAFGYTKPAWEALVREIFVDLVEEPVLPELFEAIYLRFARGQAWRVPPDVEPCLRALRARKLRLVMVSNFDERLGQVMSEVGLAGYFEHIVASGPLGWHKPETAIFQETARRLGLLPASILHVGDSIEEDVEGARESGFDAVLLDRTRLGVGSRVITSLADLAGWIQRREHGSTN